MKKLTILTLKDRYPTQFMSPRRSQHDVKRVPFVPFNLIDSRLDGFSIVATMQKHDLLHVQNRVPIGARKYIISFESHLPRSFGLSASGSLYAMMRRGLESLRCRRIIAMSHFAKRIFCHEHQKNEVLLDKLLVRHPNIDLSGQEDPLRDDSVDKIRIAFVGSHFGRKGGCVAVRIAERALARRLPIEIHIVSALEVGGRVWTDPSDPGFFKPYLDLLSLPNVVYHGALPNSDVKQLLGRCHFSLLTTFGDTFGFSAIESMSEHTPVIATNICALPEFVTDGINGIMLPLNATALGEWDNPGWHKRGTKEYEQYFRDEVERLTELTLARIESFLGAPEKVLPLRRGARRTAETMFAAGPASEFWDGLYTRVAGETVTSPARVTADDRSSPESFSPVGVL